MREGAWIPENSKTVAHLATLAINATRIKEDARGERIGMGNYYRRKQIFAAMKALKIAMEHHAPEARLAGGFPRLMMIMKGMVPQIHTFGIMSPDNPQGKQVTPEQNNLARKRLKESLDHMGFGYVTHMGHYGPVEMAFFIMNIPAADMQILRENYDQDTVITGEIDHREGDKSTTTFKLVDAYGVRAERLVVLDVNTTGDNYYSEVKGRKFVIPFFDESYNQEHRNNEDNAALEGEDMESNVVNPFTTSEIPENSETVPHLATLAINAGRIKEDARGERIGMGNYYRRKQIFAAMKALKLAAEHPKE